MGSGEDWGRSDWLAGYHNSREHPQGSWLHTEEGVVPQDLCGTYFRNGPGILELGGAGVVHPYDGQGIVGSFAFQRGQVFFRSRFVQTAQFAQEHEQQRFLYPGAFGTRPCQSAAGRGHLPGFLPKNVANTSVLPWRDNTCLALYEAGPPHALDAATLDTVGESLLGGLLRPGVPFASGLPWLDRAAGRLLSWVAGPLCPEGGIRLGGDALCAHVCQDPVTHRTVLMSYRLALSRRRQGLRKGVLARLLRLLVPALETQLTFWELDQDCNVVTTQGYALDGYAFVHDFATTRDHYVIFNNPVSLALLPLILGHRSCVQCISFQAHEPLQTHLVPRGSASSCSHAHACRKGACVPGTRPPCCRSSKHPPPAEAGGRCSTQPFKAAQLSSKKAAGGRLGTCSDVHHRDSLLIQRYDSALLDEAGDWQLPAGLVREEADNDARAGRQDCLLAAHTVTCEAAFAFHHVNAYTDGTDVIVDSICYSSFPDFFQLGKPGTDFFQDINPATQPISQLWRIHIDLQAGTASRRRVLERAVEFPAVHPNLAGRRHRYVWLAAALSDRQNAPQQALACVDTSDGSCKVWSRGKRYFAGEPILVAREANLSGEDPEQQAWLLAVCFDAAKARSELVILDAAHISQGPVAVLPLGGILPHGLHGCWDSLYHGPTVPCAS